MKYNELHRKLKKAGCYPTGRELCGHPEWFSPLTDQYFATSHHGKEEVARGTLRNIKKASGVDL
ncbi:MAG: type II toxin-antitoxin system HicA family toxin [Bacteroides sp.]|nr:type II toxin-antitoxin system HicA family toxin [Bacteroides sp.]